MCNKLLWSMLLPLVVAQSLHANESTVLEIADNLNRNFDSIGQFHVRWRVETETRIVSDQKVSQPRTWTVSDEYAKKQGWRSRRYVRPLKPSEPDGVREECKYVFDGNATRSQILRIQTKSKKILLRDNYYIEVGGDKGTSAQMQQDIMYFECLGNPYYNGRLQYTWRRQFWHDGKTTRYSNEDPDRQFSIFDAMRTGRYTIRGAPETVDGVKCLVVECPKSDVLWLDPARGYALIKRNWYWSDGRTVMVEYRNSDHREISPGLWWPTSATRTTYVDTRINPSMPADAIESVDYVRVESMEATRVPDELFHSSPVVGSTIMDNTLVKRDGKPVLLSYLVGKTPKDTERSMQDGITRATEYTNASRLTPLKAFFLCVDAAIVLAIIFVFVWRRRRKTASNVG